MELGKFGGEVVRHMRKQIELEQDWVRHLRRCGKTTATRDRRSLLAHSRGEKYEIDHILAN
jgi:hypothetical protein